MDSTELASKNEELRSRNVRAIRVFIGFLALLGILALLALLSYIGAYVHFHFHPMPKD